MLGRMNLRTNALYSALRLSGVALAGTSLLALRAFDVSLDPLGGYSTFKSAGAEIPAYDPLTRRVFVVNGADRTVDVLDLKDPSHPTRSFSLDVAAYGWPNSVAVRRGLVAVVVGGEGEAKTQPGTVIFFNAHGKFLNALPVGPLPDMITFTPDGRWLLVANEGEPSDDYSRDPEGSVSCIRLRDPLNQGQIKKLGPADVITADFRAFNEVPLDPSVRIFGPGASVAQDLEPEYIVVAPDSRTAYVTCQENNALAVLDLATCRFTHLVGFGFKDHNRTLGATLEVVPFGPLPSIGSTMAGQQLFLGGFSGLWFDGVDQTTGRLRFITHTDRGPNGEPTGNDRPFLLPGFTPEIVFFEVDPATQTLALTRRLPLKDPAGNPLTGLPNTALAGASANAPYQDERPVDLFGNLLPLDLLGADLEGLAKAPDGSFWMVDEYRPALYQFDPSGVMLDRFVPEGTAAAAGRPAGTYGTEVLPAILAQRRQNRGFEAVALAGAKLYAWVQSPLRNPATASNSTLNANRSVRILEFDTLNHATRQYLHLLDNLPAANPNDSRADKIGDAVAFGGAEFLVVERDDDALPDDQSGDIQKRIYRVNLAGATDVSALSDAVFHVNGASKRLDQLTADELAAHGIRPVAKTLHVDLNAAGYNRVEKVEGLALVNGNTLAVLNDNDFGVANIAINPADGTFVVNGEPDPILLGLLRVHSTGLDASDRDGRINIRPWPVRGMYLPDAIAAFAVGGSTYLITANEGDARAYAAFNEEAAVRSLALDPVAFPDAAALKTDALLGRLAVTRTLGDTDGDGDYDELYAFGGRSFSIWDTAGQLVFDSGDWLEQLTSDYLPAFFNANNDGNRFDNRSDNKGPEPEGVVVGQVHGRPLAFLALERVGGVAVFDLSTPAAPRFAGYVNTRDFSVDPATGVSDGTVGDLGPEGLAFIAASESPNSQPLLVVANEISGTTRVFQLEVTP